MVQPRLVNGSLLFQRLLLPPRQGHGSAGRQARNLRALEAAEQIERRNAQCKTRRNSEKEIQFDGFRLW